MDNKYILAIDQGTSSSRSIIFDKEAQIISIAQKELKTSYPRPGWIEQDALEILESTLEVIFESLKKANLTIFEIAAIGITNQRETTIIWDKKTGQPVYPAIVWQSRQTADLCQSVIDQGYQNFIKEKTGLLVDPYFSASKIRFILDRVYQGQRRAEKGELMFGTVDSWLLYNLTDGKLHYTDVSNASRTLLMDLKTLKWDEELCQIWDIPLEILPEIKATSEVYGNTSEKIFKAKIPISALVGDQQAALFGQTCFKEGMVKNTYGTGCFMLMNVGNQIKYSEHGLLTTVAWKIKDEITYALEGSVFMAGAALQWLRDGLKILENTASSEAIALSLSSNGGVYVVPAFVGLGAPYWDAKAKGAIFGLTRGTTSNELIRATLESLAYQTVDVLKAMEKDSDLKLIDLRVDGGASQNNFLLQFQADLLDVNVIRPTNRETTALGAAFLAGLAIGYFKDINSISKLYKIESSISPNLDEALRLSYLENWQKAVAATLTFSK